MQPIDTAKLKLLEDPDELMTTREGEQNDEIFWFPSPEKPGNEDNLTPIQRRTLEEIRKMVKKEELNPTKHTESRKAFVSMFKWECSHTERKDREQLDKQ